MRLEIKGTSFENLGDPHLGRPFVKGVPLHRRGEREAMQRVDFRASLQRAADVHVCLGDLFDRVVVANAVIGQAADDYAELKSDDTIYVCLVGNHDVSRDTGVLSSFEIWAKIVEGDVVVPMGKPYVLERNGGKFVFCPWHPTLTALEVVDLYADLIRDADVLFGHYDVVAIHATDNLVPAARLVELGVKLVVTGHDHNRRELVIDGLDVIVTGSLQPYSHGEDEDERIYITLSAQEALAQLVVGGEEHFAHNCLRVVGEWPHEIPNCLQFQIMSEAEADEEGQPTVGFAAFDFQSLWATAFANVDPDINEQLLERFREIGGEE
jgi:DNA repair exonuclease SbcCD nuclease subunit